VVGRAMNIGVDDTGLDFDICLQEYRLHEERASGQTLTESAMANCRSFRVAERPISDVPAQATALMNFRHLPLRLPACRSCVLWFSRGFRHRVVTPKFDPVAAGTYAAGDDLDATARRRWQSMPSPCFRRAGLS
jgi:hypothetical protein